VSLATILFELQLMLIRIVWIQRRP